MMLVAGPGCISPVAAYRNRRRKMDSTARIGLRGPFLCLGVATLWDRRRDFLQFASPWRVYVDD